MFEGSEERQTEVEECRSWHAGFTEKNPLLIEVSCTYTNGQSIEDVNNRKNNLMIRENRESYTRLLQLAN